MSHALTFAATHLAAVHFVRRVAPEGTANTAQSLYSAIGLGLSSAVLTSISGFVFQSSPAGAFYCMALSAATGLTILCILWKNGMEIVWLLSLPTKNTDRLEKLMTTLAQPLFCRPSARVHSASRNKDNQLHLCHRHLNTPAGAPNCRLHHYRKQWAL